MIVAVVLFRSRRSDAQMIEFNEVEVEPVTQRFAERNAGNGGAEDVAEAVVLLRIRQRAYLARYSPSTGETPGALVGLDSQKLHEKQTFPESFCLLALLGFQSQLPFPHTTFAFRLLVQTAAALLQSPMVVAPATWRLQARGFELVGPTLCVFLPAFGGPRSHNSFKWDYLVRMRWRNESSFRSSNASAKASRCVDAV